MTTAESPAVVGFIEGAGCPRFGTSVEINTLHTKKKKTAGRWGDGEMERMVMMPERAISINPVIYKIKNFYMKVAIQKYS